MHSCYSIPFPSGTSCSKYGYSSRSAYPNSRTSCASCSQDACRGSWRAGVFSYLVINLLAASATVYPAEAPGHELTAAVLTAVGEETVYFL